MERVEKIDESIPFRRSPKLSGRNILLRVIAHRSWEARWRFYEEKIEKSTYGVSHFHPTRRDAGSFIISNDISASDMITGESIRDFFPELPPLEPMMWVENRIFSPEIPDAKTLIFFAPLRSLASGKEALQFSSLYESKLIENARATRIAANEKALEEAAADRNLLSAFMDNDWLGLTILTALRKSKRLNLSELVSALGKPPNSVAASLAKLAIGKVIDIEGDCFRNSDRGETLLANIERTTGIALGP
jgi:hypothetical protein